MKSIFFTTVLYGSLCIYLVNSLPAEDNAKVTRTPQPPNVSEHINTNAATVGENPVTSENSSPHTTIVYTGDKHASSPQVLTDSLRNSTNTSSLILPAKNNTSKDKSPIQTTVTDTVTPSKADSTIVTPKPPSSTAIPNTNGTSTIQPVTSRSTSTNLPPLTNKADTVGLVSPNSTNSAPLTMASTSQKCPDSQTTASTPPEPTVAPLEAQKGRQFDGPSFIGGIVLALGLTGIGFITYKFCKTRADRNYRNL